MQYKRILTVQDISCVGKCSMTIALPVLAAMGHETCVLPTAVLSTHTGGFGRPQVVHLDDRLEDFRRHWQNNGITFDAVLVGYLGSLGAAEAAGEILDTMLAPGGLAVVDPVLGDNGRLYAGFDEKYVEAVAALAKKADILLPNLTEAALLTGRPYREVLDEARTEQMLSALGKEKVLLTGVSREPGRTGFAMWEKGAARFYSHPRLGGGCHGTGDLFAAVFTGAVLQGKEIYEAGKTAADFVCRTIGYTLENPENCFGVKFEPLLGDLAKENLSF